jgi:hypothetical protein
MEESPRKLPRKAISLLLTVLLVGCASHSTQAPPLLALPQLHTTDSHYAGTPLSGARPIVPDVTGAIDASTVSVKWVALAAAPASVQQYFAARCRLIVAGRSGSPILSSPDLTRSVLFCENEQASALETQYTGAATIDSAPIAAFAAALPSKVTAVFSASPANPTPPHDDWTVRLARGATDPTAIELALQIERDPSTTTQPASVMSETAVIDRTLVRGEDHLAIFIPARFSDSTARVLAAFIDISAAPSADLLANCQDHLKASADLAGRQPTTAVVEGAASAAYESALAALAEPSQRRAALVFLSAQTQAHICEDTALVADEGLLAKLAGLIEQRAGGVSESSSDADLAWLLDRAAFQLLVAIDTPGGTAIAATAPATSTTSTAAQTPLPLPPELKAVLTVYAGEPARHAGSLDDIARDAASRQDLENRLTAENLVFLTDSSPASRVRAFDWLKARKLAPPGFDPLGPPRQRREALDKALASD